MHKSKMFKRCIIYEKQVDEKQVEVFYIMINDTILVLLFAIMSVTLAFFFLTESNNTLVKTILIVIEIIFFLFVMFKKDDKKNDSQKKLLILDMNNVLVFRVFIPSQEQEQPDTIPFNDLATISPNKRFYTWQRPHLDSFIDFCLENYNVAVWSSARRENVDHLIDLVFGKIRRKLLAFEWDQSHCESHSQGAFSEKPIFFKNLSKVWDKYPCYNQTNTYLADDSAKKSENNPPGTVITLDPWYPHKGSGFNDCDLGERGNIRLLLDRLKKNE